MARIEIEFKKELGFERIDFRWVFVPFELGSKEFITVFGGRKFKIKMGEFGTNKEELIFLSTFNHDHIIPSSPILTFDIVFEDDLEIDFEKINTNDLIENKKLEYNLKSNIPICIEVINYFMLAYRKVKIEIPPNHINQNLYTIIETTKGFMRRELENSLFYRVRLDSEEIFGHLSNGRGHTTRQLTNDELELIQKYFEDRVDIPIRLLLQAREYHVSEDHRMSLFNAAMSLEIIIKRFLNKKLEDQCRGISSSQRDKFIENTSTRLLATIALSILTTIDINKLDKCRELLEKRNGIAHGKKHGVKPQEAFDAILLVEEMYNLLDIGSL